MAQVLGLGGVFFKARDPEGLRAWYARVLGVEAQAWGGLTFPAALAGAREGAFTIVGPMPEDTTYFDPSPRPLILNFIVDDLDGMLAHAQAAGVTPAWRDDDDPNGRFAHLIDPEGGKVELWEPRTSAAR